MKWPRRGGGTAPGDAGPVARSGVFKTDESVTAPGGPAPVPAGAGAPALQRLTGGGSGVLDLTTGARPVILGIAHHGSGHFVVDALDKWMRSGSQLVYTDGPFTCRALANADDRPVRALRIEADGPWTGEVPLSGPCLVYARSDGPWSISVRDA
ncbi:hypothetical protein ACFW1F_13790 [Streptomyces bungoensis]|uniref:hypothetical protein n=1 Tax=Streptomyces bungoensis TaxID=285568 RepID=UPI0036A8DD9D